MNINTQEARCMIRDLGEKYPMGPLGRITKLYYRSKEEWVDVYQRHTTVHRIAEGTPERICPDARRRFFGYDPVAMYRLGIRNEDDAIHAAAMVRRDGESRMVNKRRGRLAWIRIKDANRHVSEVGTEGLWKASFGQAGWGHPLYTGLIFYSKSKADVEARVSMIAPMLGADLSWRPNVHFESLGTPEDAAVQNNALISHPVTSAQRVVNDAEQRLEQARKKLAEAQDLVGKVMGAVMLDMDSSEVPPEEPPAQ